MPKILHAADLHLSESERDYGLSVLSGLLDLARRREADYLIFCGDLFDTFADAEKLRGDFRGLLGNPGFEFIYLPGNHEDIRRGGGELARLDLGAVTLAGARPCQLLARPPRRHGDAAVEFLAIPHQEHYADYGSWEVPPRGAPWRIALAHGVVAGMAYQGPDEEGGANALDPDLFQRLGADYAALGHIHGRRCQRIGDVTAAYPGSSRVWRRQETGARGALWLDLPDRPPRDKSSPAPEPVFLPLAEAGEYRRHVLPLSLEGELPELDGWASAWRAPDFVELELSGLVEDERPLAGLAAGLHARYGGKVRRLEVRREGVSVLPGISSHPIAKGFLEGWRRRMPEPGHPDHPVWLRSRELALASLKAGLEKRA